MRDAQPIVRLLAEPFAERQAEHKDENERHGDQDHGRAACPAPAGGDL